MWFDNPSALVVREQHRTEPNRGWRYRGPPHGVNQATGCQTGVGAIVGRRMESTRQPAVWCAGGLLGGFIGDAAAARFPDHGRIAVTQVSVVSGVPLSLLLMKVRSHLRLASSGCESQPQGIHGSAVTSSSYNRLHVVPGDAAQTGCTRTSVQWLSFV